MESAKSACSDSGMSPIPATSSRFPGREKHHALVPWVVLPFDPAASFRPKTGS